MKYFTFDRNTGSVDIEDSRILVVKEFKALLEPSRNMCEEDKKGTKGLHASKEIVYMFLYLDWDSPYFKYSEEDRRQAAYEDSGLTEQELEDEVFVTACVKYNELQANSLDIRLLRSAMDAVEKVIFYLSTVDPNERNPIDGKPIFKTKDIIAEIKGAKDIITSLRELEDKVKENMVTESSVRGDAELGFFDN